MNSDIFIRRMKELNKSINELERKLDYGYDDNLEHDYGYESSYHNLYDTHQFPHPRNKDFPTIPSEPVSKHQVNDACNPIRYPTQINRAVRKQAKPSPFDFPEIPGAPRPMPKGYSEGFPRYYANAIESIEKHLDSIWYYMEAYGAEHEDVYMRALGESLGGNANFWLYTLAPESITRYDMFTELLRKEWGKIVDESMQPNNDCLVEDQSDEDDQDNHSEITDDFLYQIDSSSPDPTMDMPLNDSSMQENNDEKMSPL